MEHCLCAGRRGGNEAGCQRAEVPRVRPTRPLPSLMPFNAATLRLCSRRMFSWDALRLGCLRKHCMIQRGAPGEASGVGGPRHPREGPRSSSSLRRPRPRTGLRGGGSGRAQAEEGRGGQSPAGGGTVEVSPPASLTSSHAGCRTAARRLPAAAQVEGTSFPTVARQWVFMHHFQGLEESQTLFAAPNQCLGLSAQPAHKRLGRRARLHPFSSAQGCAGLFPLTCGHEEAKNTF